MWVFRHKDIVKSGELYLRRYYITPRKWPYKVMLHYIRKPDNDRDPHDHPWSFLTLILWGGYLELVFKTEDQLRGKVPMISRLLRVGFVWRRAEHIHQIHSLLKPTWTLVFAGRGRRVWGFWNSFAEFIPWTSYLRREDGAIPESLPEDGDINCKAINA
jgi:hypothetical protein